MHKTPSVKEKAHDWTPQWERVCFLEPSPQSTATSSGLSWTQPTSELSSNHSSPFLTSATSCWLKWINVGLFMLCSDFLTWKQVGKESIRKQTFHIFEDVERMYWSRTSDGWAGTCLLTVLQSLFHSGCRFLGTNSHKLSGCRFHLLPSDSCLSLTSLTTCFLAFPQLSCLEWGPGPGLPQRVSLVSLPASPQSFTSNISSAPT